MVGLDSLSLVSSHSGWFPHHHAPPSPSGVTCPLAHLIPPPPAHLIPLLCHLTFLLFHPCSSLSRPCSSLSHPCSLLSRPCSLLSRPCSSLSRLCSLPPLLLPSSSSTFLFFYLLPSTFLFFSPFSSSSFCRHVTPHCYCFGVIVSSYWQGGGVSEGDGKMDHENELQQILWLVFGNSFLGLYTLPVLLVTLSTLILLQVRH